MKNLFATLALMVAMLILSLAAYAAPAYKDMTIRQLMKEHTKASKEEKNAIVNALRNKPIDSKDDRDALYEALDSSDFETHYLAISYVSVTKEARSYKKLIDTIKGIKTSTAGKVLTSSNEKVYQGVSVRVLATAKNREALPIIVDKLAEASGNNISMLEVALSESVPLYGASAMPYIAEKLNSGKIGEFGKKELLKTVSGMKDKAAIPTLKQLSNSSDIDIRTAANAALGNVGEKFDLTGIYADIRANDELEKAHTEKTKEFTSKHRMVPDNINEESDRLNAAKIRLYDTLAASKNPDALPFLKERVEARRKKNPRGFVEDSYWELKTMAHIGGPEVLSYFIGIYNEFDRKKINATYNEIYISKKKCEVLRQVGVKGFNDAIPFLTEIMDNKANGNDMRRCAAYALRDITDDSKYYDMSNEIQEGKR